jgi:cytochrome c biogenesis protein CcmG/thiol:disulfide interchange protein DsbE
MNFWATWCSPCKIEIPWFVGFQQRFSELAILGVSMDDDGWNSVKPFLAEVRHD